MQQTITIYTGYGTSRLVNDGVKVFTVQKELLGVGKEIVKNSFGHEIPIYNRERTFCDLIRSRSRFEIQDYRTALKTYIGGKDKDLNRLMEYMNNSEIVLFETADNSVVLPVHMTGDTVWLNRSQMAELFERDVKTIGKHINNALREEIDSSVVANLRQLLLMEKRTRWNIIIWI